MIVTVKATGESVDVKPDEVMDCIYEDTHGRLYFRYELEFETTLP